jgi:DNA replication and repair protein RecF
MVGTEGRGFRIAARLQSGGFAQHGGIEYSDKGLRVRLGGQELASISSLSREFPVQILDPSIHRLIEEGASRRRRLLDWGVFHVEPTFLVPWRRYQRAISQRNAALRRGLDPVSVDSWSEELIATAADIDRFRSAYISSLQVVFKEITQQLLGAPVALEYFRGWDADQPLAAALRLSTARDRKFKATTVGPHRADLAFKIDGKTARDRVSRGQQKMLAVSLVLAQVRLRAISYPHPQTCLLLDDPAAELDVDNLGKVLQLLAELPAQLVVTSLTPEGLRGLSVAKTFHVEQGRFTQML